MAKDDERIKTGQDFGSSVVRTIELASALGLTVQRLGQFARDGLMERSQKNTFVLGPSIQAYIKFVKGERSNSIGLSLNDNKSRLYSARATLAQLEADRKAGLLIPAPDVEKTWTEALVRVRQRLLAMPSKAAPMLAVEDDVAECHALLEKFIHEALDELSNTDVVVASGPRGGGADAQGGAQGPEAAAEDDGERVGGREETS